MKQRIKMEISFYIDPEEFDSRDANLERLVIKNLEKVGFENIAAEVMERVNNG